ncbi:MAG: UDP-glucose 4-epimerase [Candidatus Levybacteria bacterium GW2011_GWB1_35_5]|nr:MAG: UDP-glucose 4-epimerase [Candidatus Levybacteria bacterium GW2011_GWB1_35_5]
MKILVTGGAGYIGSFMVRKLLERGDEVTVFDNLERGHRKAIDPRAKFIKGDIKNNKDLEYLFVNSSFEAIMHFAGLIAVGESEEKPDLYYQNNVVGSKNLFKTALNIGRVKKFIFSSSAAVYGNPREIPIPESHPKNPTSEYGKNKLAVEEILLSLQKNNPEVGFIALRYFNAAGAAMDGSLGEGHNPETHIIPSIIKSALLGIPFKVFGNDYKTKDGMLALEKLHKEKRAYTYNVGTGIGYSNKQVIEAVKKVSGKNFDVEYSQRRKGDVDELIADPSKIKTELGFSPRFSDLNTIVNTAWQWHQKQ